MYIGVTEYQIIYTEKTLKSDVTTIKSAQIFHGWPLFCTDTCAGFVTFCNSVMNDSVVETEKNKQVLLTDGRICTWLKRFDLQVLPTDGRSFCSSLTGWPPPPSICHKCHTAYSCTGHVTWPDIWLANYICQWQASKPRSYPSLKPCPVSDRQTDWYWVYSWVTRSERP